MGVDASNVWRSGVEPEQQRTGVLDSSVIIGFLLGQSAILLFVLSLYHSTNHKRIRKQQTGGSSTWKVLGYIDKTSSIIRPQTIISESRLFSFSVLCVFILFSFLKSVYGLLLVFSWLSHVLTLTFPLSLIKESEFRTRVTDSCNEKCHYFKIVPPKPAYPGSYQMVQTKKQQKL